MLLSVLLGKRLELGGFTTKGAADRIYSALQEPVGGRFRDPAGFFL
jgi:hypothetical protein